MSLLTFNPAENSDEYNIKWGLLRSIEWGNWPLFLSQSLAPVLLLFLRGDIVLVCVFAANMLWAGIRYRYVSVNAAHIGAYVVLLKWVICPSAALYLYLHGETLRAALALLWPLLVFIALPVMPLPPRIGDIQAVLMKKLGYEPPT